MELSLEYPTHKLLLSTEGNFIKVKNYVLGNVYQDMVSAILSEKDEVLNFVQNERILLNNFLRSIIELHNKEMSSLTTSFFDFKDEFDYYIFCVVNDVEFKEQQWFNVVYIETDILTAYTYLKNASIKMISMVYPEYIDHPANLLLEWWSKIKLEQAKFKCNPDEFKSFLEKNEIDCLYHFTSSNNVESIKKTGICSIKHLKEQGICVDYASSINSQYIDKKKGLEDYIHLGYEAKHPMLMNALAKGILCTYAVYQVNPIVLFLKNTKYSRCNAIKRDAFISDDINYFLNIPFKKFHKKNYFKLSECDKELFQSEVLVCNNIPNELIFN